MAEKILVPVLGESITEATVSKWLKNKGDSIVADEPIVELETDKVNLEVPAPNDGVLSEVNFKNGDTVEVGAILGEISTTEQKITKSENKAVKQKPEEKQINNVINFDKEKVNQPKIFEDIKATDDEISEKPLVLTKEHKAQKNYATNKTLSPAVRKIVEENNIKIETVKGTGKSGQILKGDLISLMGTNPMPSERKIKFGEEERIRMSRLRQTIAKRLKQAQENAAMLTTFNEVDMGNIIEMRKNNQERFSKSLWNQIRFYVFFCKGKCFSSKIFSSN